MTRIGRRRPGRGDGGEASAERLTSWAGGSENRAVHFIRTTLGPLLLILLTPSAAILFWIVCTFEPFNGSIVPYSAWLAGVPWRRTGPGRAPSRW